MSRFFDRIWGTKVGYSSRLDEFHEHNQQSEFAESPIGNRPSSIGNSRVPLPVSLVPSPCLTLGGSEN